MRLRLAERERHDVPLDHAALELGRQGQQRAHPRVHELRRRTPGVRAPCSSCRKSSHAAEERMRMA